MQLTKTLKVVVTGANGQLGYQLVKKLQNRVTLAAFDKSTLNIVDRNQLQVILKEFSPDVIINAAAYTASDKAEQEIESAIAINSVGPANLASIAAELGAVLIHVSTDYVFDGMQSKPYTETDTTNPISIYGSSKLAGELEICKLSKKHIILRTSWVFAEHGNNFVKTMLRLAQNRPELGVVVDQIGAPTYAGDIADTIINILSQLEDEDDARYGVYHYSGLPYVSWHEFAQQIFAAAVEQNIIKKTPKINPITTEEYPTAAKRPEFSMLDCSKIKKNFGILPSNWQVALNDLSLYR